MMVIMKSILWIHKSRCLSTLAFIIDDIVHNFKWEWIQPDVCETDCIYRTFTIVSKWFVKHFIVKLTVK